MPDDRPPAISAYLNTKADGTVAFADISGSSETGYYAEVVWIDNRSETAIGNFTDFLEAKRAVIEELTAISANYKDSEIRWRV